MFSSDKLNELLKTKGWSNYRLAQESGLGPSTINEITNGKKRTPNADTLFKIALALNVPIDALFTDSTIKDELKDLLPKLSKLSKDDIEIITALIDKINK